MSADKELTHAELELKQKREWLIQHGPYEVDMMRYSLRRMCEEADLRLANPSPPHDARREYNAHFECFATKARVLIDFFACRRGNLKATHFAAYSAPPRDHIQTTINKIDTHVSHPGADRSPTQDGKITLGDCKEIAAWIEKALAKFLQTTMNKPFVDYWNNPSKRGEQEAQSIRGGDASASAAAPIEVKTEPGK